MNLPLLPSLFFPIYRVPALQFLLLFGSFIDTNSSVDRIVVDSWLELAFSSPEDGQQVLSAVVALRDTWSALLNLKLDRQTKIRDVAFDQVAHSIKVGNFVQFIVGYSTTFSIRYFLLID